VRLLSTCCAALQVITKRNGEDTKKRGVVLRDDSGRSIELTLWGEFVNVPGGDAGSQHCSGAVHRVLPG
jgi:hypothetical protein